MKILVQDRNNAVDYRKEQVHVDLLIKGKDILAYSLKQGDYLLGTYDDMDSLMHEAYNILHCEYEYYVMGGFDDYEECFSENL